MQDQATQAEDSATRSFLVALVVLTFAMNLIARGVPETFAVFLLPVQKGLGVSRADITLTYSVYMLTYGLAAPFAGELIDRFGARVAYGFGLASLGLGYLLASLATELWHYLLAVGLLGGLGAASLGMIVASSLLSRWFATHIGSIMSLPYAAIGVGMLLLPPLTQVLLSIYGWRVTHAILGAGVLLALPLVMLLPLGRMTAGSQAWRSMRSATAASATGHWRISTALRTSAFWGLFAAYLFTAVAAFSVLPHSVAYLIERGFDPLVAAAAFGLCRHAFGHRHRRHGLAVGPLRPQTSSDTFVHFDHRRHRRAGAGLALAHAGARLCLRVLLRPDAGRARAHHRRHGGRAVSGRHRRHLWHVGGGAGVGRGARLVGLGPALRAYRRLHRLVPGGHLRIAGRACHLLGREKPARGKGRLADRAAGASLHAGAGGPG